MVTRRRQRGRDPVDRVLSAYEFALEVAVRAVRIPQSRPPDSKKARAARPAAARPAMPAACCAHGPQLPGLRVAAGAPRARRSGSQPGLLQTQCGRAPAGLARRRTALEAVRPRRSRVGGGRACTCSRAACLGRGSGRSRPWLNAPRSRGARSPPAASGAGRPVVPTRARHTRAAGGP
jgi:hypothetical protein